MAPGGRPRAALSGARADLPSPRPSLSGSCSGPGSSTGTKLLERGSACSRACTRSFHSSCGCSGPRASSASRGANTRCARTRA